MTSERLASTRLVVPANLNLLSVLDRAVDTQKHTEDMAVNWGLERTSDTISEEGGQIAQGRG